MRKSIINLLLAILNTEWLNATPCKYGFIGNIDAFSYENLASEEKQRPGITVKEVLETADRFKSCPINKNGLTVIDGDETREASVWDRHELRQAFTRSYLALRALREAAENVCYAWNTEHRLGAAGYSKTNAAIIELAHAHQQVLRDTNV